MRANGRTGAETVTRRATFTEAELIRAWKAAQKVGAAVEVVGGAIRLLPEGAQSAQDATGDDEVDLCDKAFGVSR
jgi:hypothetical protein